MSYPSYPRMSGKKQYYAVLNDMDMWLYEEFGILPPTVPSAKENYK